MTKQKDNKDELFIVQRMIEGDKKAFRYFFDKYYSDLCNFVNIYVNDRALAEEVVQDIFVYFWENKSALRLKHSVRSYLFSASKYRSLKEIRNQNTRQRIRSELAAVNVGYQPEKPSSFFEPEQFREVLNSAVNKLPNKCREIFILSKNKNLTNKEIAEELNVSVKTVENQMTIALKKLREYLAPYRGEIFVLFLLSFLS